MFVFGVIEVLIAIRFLFTLLGANAEAGFVKFVQNLSGVFMTPFDTIFKTQSVSGATFEWSALVAIAVYALIAWGIVALVRSASPRRHSETVERVEQVEKDDNVVR
ncbi:MAG: YggT family protein [Coriobacteriia bacterium]